MKNKSIIAITGLLLAVSNSWATVITDNFDRANTTQTQAAVNVGGTGWTQGGTASDWFIDGNALAVQARGSVRLYNTGLESLSGNGTNFTVQADVSGANNTWVGIIFNYTDDLNYYALRFKAGATDYQVVQRVSTGLATLKSAVATSTFAANTYYTLTVTSAAAGVFGFTIDQTGVGNVISLTSVDDSASALTGGYAGLYNATLSSTPNAHYDNFSLNVIPEPATISLFGIAAGLVFFLRRGRRF